jgi:hypothetical protein
VPALRTDQAGAWCSSAQGSRPTARESVPATRVADVERSEDHNAVFAGGGHGPQSPICSTSRTSMRNGCWRAEWFTLLGKSHPVTAQEAGGAEHQRSGTDRGDVRVRGVGYDRLLLASLCSFVRACGSFVPAYNRRSRRAQERSRPAGAVSSHLALPLPGRALTAPSTARGQARRDAVSARLDTLEGAPLVEDRPGDAVDDPYFLDFIPWSVFRRFTSACCSTGRPSFVLSYA